MASNRWLGRAQAIAQVDTVTVANTWATNDTITLTINTKSLVLTVGTNTTTTQVALALKEAWQNGTFTDTSSSKTPANGGQGIIEHAEITATQSGAVVTLTRNTPGEPFVMAVTEVTGGDGTATEATATAADGPNFYDNTDNWSLAAVPIATNDVFVDDSSVSILHGMGQSAIAIASFTVGPNYTGDIGLPKQNAGGYVEYRADYLAIDAAIITIGRGEGAASGLINIDSGSTQTAIAVENAGQFNWKGTHASNTLEVLQGIVDVAVFGGEVATIATLSNAEGTVRCSDRVTLTTVTNGSGGVSIYSNAVTLTNASGIVLLGGSAALTTLNLDGGTMDHQSSGTIATANVGGLLDCSGDNSARTITNCTLNLNGRISDPLQTVTYTNGILLGTGVASVSAA